MYLHLYVFISALIPTALAWSTDDSTTAHLGKSPLLRPVDLKLNHIYFDSLMMDEPDIKVRSAVHTAKLPLSRCRMSMDRDYGGTAVDCSHAGLNAVDQGQFPGNTTSLWLDGNNLTVLVNNSFTELSSLRFLSIRNSRVTTLQVGAFLNLSLLEHLNLEGNNLPISKKAFPAKMFQPMPRLKHLFLAYNVQGFFSNWEVESTAELKAKRHNYSQYIDIFQDLPHLESLSIDSFPSLYLGQEFSEFVNLTNIIVHCTLVDTAFNDSLVGLATLNLTSFSLTRFSEILAPILPLGIFRFVSNVTTFIIDKCNIGNHNILRTLWPFKNKTMSRIVLNDTKICRYTESPKLTFTDGILTVASMEHLTTICVRHLVISNNKIFALEPGVIWNPTWARCLEVMDLSSNQMGISGWRIVLFELHRLNMLRELILTSAPASYEDIHPRFPGKFHKDSELKTQEDTTGERLLLANTSNSDTSIQKRMSHNQHYVMNGTDYPLVTVPIPKNLRILRLAYYTLQSFIQFRCTWHLLNTNHLRELYVVNIPQFLYSRGRLLGLSSLRILYVSGSMLDVRDHIYDDLTSLQVLVLSAILPKHYFDTVVDCPRLLRNLSNLEYLELSNNELNSLPTGVFSNNPKLEYLVLDKNRFSNIPFDLKDTPNLISLSLLENAVISLEDSEMEALDKHVSKVHFSLKLQGNAIVCICSRIKFLGWLRTTSIDLDEDDGYVCTSQDGSVSNTTAFTDVEGFWRLCVGSLSLVVSLVIATVMALGFVTVYLIMRFKLSLMAVIFKMVAPQFKVKAMADYKTNIFIGYSDEDYKFVRNILLRYLEKDLGLTTFIHDRDMEAGYVDQLFFHAVQDSWRICLLVTRSFLETYNMADIIMKYALHSVSPENQGRVFLLVEKTELFNVPDYLYNVMDDSRIVVLRNMAAFLSYEQKDKIKRCMEPT